MNQNASRRALSSLGFSFLAMAALQASAGVGCVGEPVDESIGGSPIANVAGDSQPLVGSATIDGFTTAGAVSAQNSTNWSTYAYNSENKVENNDWGIPQNGQGGSTIFTETVNGAQTFGWAWNVYNGTNVAIYPEVGYGWSPNGNSSWGGNPVIPQLSEHKSITTNFSIIGQHSPNGTWDMAYDIWITPAAHPATTDGSFELMIWLDHNQQGPWETHGPQGVVNIDGVNYQRYTNAGAAKWTCLSYINQGAGIYNGTNFSLSDVINDAAAKFGISSSYYVSSIEFGNEAVNGSGMTEISSWAVNIGAGAPPPPPPPPTAPDFSLNSWQYNAQSGVTVWNGGVGNFVPGNWIEFNGVNLSTGYNNFAVSYATAQSGSFDIHLDSVGGTVIGSVNYGSTGGWNTYTWGGTNLNASLAKGTHNLYFVSTGGAANLGALWIKNL